VRYPVPGALRISRRLYLHLYLATGLVLLTFFTLQRFSPPASSFQQQRLQAFPLQVGEWAGREGKWDQAMVAALDVDDWALRLYRHPSGAIVWFYIGFLERLTPNRSHHSPQICYPAQGWKSIQQGLQPIPLSEGKSLLINKLLVQKGLEQHLVLYWHQWGEQSLPEDRGLWGEYGYKLSALLRLLHVPHRTDRALVRISALVMDSVEETLSREVAFIQAALPLLVQHFAPAVPSP
jgi:EpsI family protein